MIFLTNKPISTFKGIRCEVTGISFNDLRGINMPKQVVVDLAPDYPKRAISEIINMFGCHYLESPVEINAGNTIYVVQDAMQNIIKLELFDNRKI